MTNHLHDKAIDSIRRRWLLSLKIVDSLLEYIEEDGSVSSDLDMGFEKYIYKLEAV